MAFEARYPSIDMQPVYETLVYNHLHSLSHLPEIELGVAFINSLTVSAFDLFMRIVCSDSMKFVKKLKEIGVPLDMDRIMNSTLAAVSDAKVAEVIAELRNDPSIAVMTMYNEIEGFSPAFRCFGKDKSAATLLARVIQLSVDKSSGALIELKMVTQKVLNYLNDPAICDPTGSVSGLDELYSHYRVFSKVLPDKRAAMLCTLVLLEDSLPDRPTPYPQIPQKLISIYRESDVFDVYSRLALEESQESPEMMEDGFVEQFNDCRGVVEEAYTKGETSCAYRDSAIRCNQTVAAEGSLRKVAALHSIADYLRERRDMLPVQDELTGHLVKLTNNVVADQYVMDLGSHKPMAVYANINDKSAFKDVYMATVKNKLIAGDGIEYNTPGRVDRSEFASIVSNETNNYFLVVDNLASTVSKNGRVWISREQSAKRIRDDFELMVGLVRGKKPLVVYWRTVTPLRREDVNMFNALINTYEDNYYYIKYYPPSKPHEPFFTVKMVYHGQEKAPPVIISEGRKLRTCTVLRYIDSKRFYYGAIFRQLVYEKFYTSYFVDMVRSYIANVKVISRLQVEAFSMTNYMRLEIENARKDVLSFVKQARPLRMVKKKRSHGTQVDKLKAFADTNFHDMGPKYEGSIAF